MKKKSKPTKGVKSRILRQIASEVKKAKRAPVEARTGYSKGDFLSGVFMKE